MGCLNEMVSGKTSHRIWACALVGGFKGSGLSSGLDTVSKRSSFIIGDFNKSHVEGRNSETKVVVGKEEAVIHISQNWEITSCFYGLDKVYGFD